MTMMTMVMMVENDSNNHKWFLGNINGRLHKWLHQKWLNQKNKTQPN